MAKTGPDPRNQKFNPGDVASLAFQTNIDRRQCQRVVPMRVLGLGVSRTGTASMRQALIDLGYSDCYHYSAALQENPPDQNMWIEAVEAKYLGKGKPYEKSDWDQLLGHCQAVTDTPCAIFWKELLEAYPDAKVVVTIRDSPEQWFRSQMETILPFFEDFVLPPSTTSRQIYSWFVPGDARTKRLSTLIVENYPMYQLLWQDRQNGTQNAKDWYENYIKEVRRVVPSEKLLVMNVKEGWKPLCEFLGAPEPLHPFPRKNDTLTFQQNCNTLAAILNQAARNSIMKTVGLTAAILVVVGWTISR